MSNSLRPHGLKPSGLLCPWNSPGKNTGGGYHSLLQGIFKTRNWTWVSLIAGRLFTIWATRESPPKSSTNELRIMIFPIKKEERHKRWVKHWIYSKFKANRVKKTNVFLLPWHYITTKENMQNDFQGQIFLMQLYSSRILLHWCSYRYTGVIKLALGTIYRNSILNDLPYEYFVKVAA